MEESIYPNKDTLAVVAAILVASDEHPYSRADYWRLYEDLIEDVKLREEAAVREANFVVVSLVAHKVNTRLFNIIRRAILYHGFDGNPSELTDGELLMAIPRLGPVSVAELREVFPYTGKKEEKYDGE